jgi:hypothetical protein
MLGLIESPRSQLATAFLFAGETNCNAAAEEVLYHMRRPGLAGVRACINAYAVLPTWARRANRHGFQYILADAWAAGSHSAQEAAGSRERIVKWFRYADFRDVSMPFLKRWTGLADLPETLTLWRGGRGSADWVAGGMSWTTSPERAAGYALRDRWSELGAPVVLRREATAAEALIYFRADHEVVLAELGPSVVETADLATMNAWAEAMKEELQQEEAALLELLAAAKADPEKVVFDGWEP